MPGSSGREIKFPFTALHSCWWSKVPSAEVEEAPPSSQVSGVFQLNSLIIECSLGWLGKKPRKTTTGKPRSRPSWGGYSLARWSKGRNQE